MSLRRRPATACRARGSGSRRWPSATSTATASPTSASSRAWRTVPGSSSATARATGRTRRQRPAARALLRRRHGLHGRQQGRHHGRGDRRPLQGRVRLPRRRQGQLAHGVVRPADDRRRGCRARRLQQRRLPRPGLGGGGRRGRARLHRQLQGRLEGELRRPGADRLGQRRRDGRRERRRQPRHRRRLRRRTARLAGRRQGRLAARPRRACRLPRSTASTGASTSAT